MSTQTLAPQNTSQSLFEKLAVLRQTLAETDDDTNTYKMTELVRKVADGEFVIGFCGHFSAGKSTMINHIVGANLLPSNPIPTTANLAKIRSASEPHARVYFQDAHAMDLSYPYELDDIRPHALNGNVRSIEIHHPLQDFEAGVTLLDTPGIDSTDDTHRMATESALHLADVIFYVTDYNHVLSEMNLAFLKQLNDLQQRIVLVVNQIDKHSSAEVDFKTYRQGIADTFSAQNIELERIFYTSLKNRDHPENQLAELKSYILDLADKKDNLLPTNAKNAAGQLIQAHIQWQAAQQSEDRDRLEIALSGVDHENLQATYHKLEQQLKEQQEKPETYLANAQKELNKTLDSAILMPYETREAGRRYIESIQSDFKAGLFASKKKTEQARQNRLDDFYNKVTDTASTLDWQVKDVLVREAEHFDIEDESYKQSIYDMQVSLDQSLLTEQVQAGATLNAQYVLRFTDKVTDAIKQRYRHAALEKLDEGKDILVRDTTASAEEIQASLGNMEEKITALIQLQQLDSNVEKEHKRLYAVLEGEVSQKEIDAALANFPDREIRSVVKIASRESKSTKQADQRGDSKKMREEPKSTVVTNQQSMERQTAKEPAPAESNDFRQRLEETAEQLEQTAQHIAPIQGLQSLAQDMRARAGRLQNNRFTIALFGAFSAGKSSFANALIEEQVLPVSPNPTTATINKILPADEDHPHETAVVQFKQKEEMLADVQKTLKPYGEMLNDLHELSDIDALMTPFLQAVKTGLTGTANQLGTKQTVDFETFYDIVANEAKAVFVESIELYIDSPLTRQGITLVDTPGADSINARHTGVAFNYIKNADAILFVTYYNHAFSQADREFLIQLGRVKDTFATDKMFFIVNAADLAETKDELDTVVDYVRDNLVSYGIRQPRVYPISSQMALAEKNGEAGSADSGMERFEGDFRQFTMDELTNAAVNAAHDDIHRAVNTLTSYITSAQEDETVRQQKRKVAKQEKDDIETFIDHFAADTQKRALEQEIEQLTYYIHQRVFLRYIDLFKETFNPAKLGNVDRNKKQILYDCLDELLQLVGFDLAQEMRATSLRIEKFIARSLDDQFTKIKTQVRDATGDTIFTDFEQPSFETPDFDNALQELDPADFADALALFKNQKQFFARDGKAVMRDRLQEQLQQPVSDYLAKEKSRLQKFYLDAYEQKAENLKSRLLGQSEEYTNGKLAALSLDTDVRELTQTKQAIEMLQNQQN